MKTAGTGEVGKIHGNLHYLEPTPDAYGTEMDLLEADGVLPWNHIDEITRRL